MCLLWLPLHFGVLNSVVRRAECLYPMTLFILTIKFCKITLEVLDLLKCCFWMGRFKEVVEFIVLNATSTLVFYAPLFEHRDWKVFFLPQGGHQSHLEEAVFKTIKESTTVKVIGIRVSTEIQREIILHLKNIYPSEFKSWLHVCFLFVFTQK